VSGVVFVDTETTGLDPDRHEIWEVGLIVPESTRITHPDRPDSYEDAEHRWFLPVDLATADVVALNIGRYHDRHPDGHSYQPTPEEFTPTDPRLFAEQFAKLTWGKHLAGAVVSFDAERLAKLLRANGACPGWHYHLIDVEALAVGYLAGMDDNLRANIAPPWKSDQLTEALGIEVDDMDKHTALGDARWAKAIYDTVMGTGAA
jgi:DNA polymerase III epsilon subunit-like protein